ncbi:CD63 antigen-like [Montipora capricornis]|uniref:CD63 antigen-like n=1 Tax=Montipora capricornis TaxID=246305 RepID=UPI0035F0FB36
MASGGMVLVKYLLFFFNLLFWVSGIALIAVGVYVKGKFGDFLQFSESEMTTGPVFLIVIGVVVTIVGFLGCCGAYKENYCMVTTFAVLLAIIFILEIAAGAYAYANRDKLKGVAKKALEDAVDNFKKEEYRKMIEEVQKEFDCCGANGYIKDYKDYKKKNISGDMKFPPSCCKNATVCPSTFGQTKNMTDSDFVTKGCVDGFEKYLKDHIFIIGGVGVGVAFLQLIGILFACCLMRSIKKNMK